MSRRLLKTSLLLAAGAGVVLVLSAVFTPETLPGVEACWFRRLTGLPCPGCGLTRSFCSISHGDFAAAWGHNPFGYLFYALALALAAWPAIERLWPGLPARLRRARLAAWLPPLLVGAMWAFGLWRIAASE